MTPHNEGMTKVFSYIISPQMAHFVLHHLTHLKIWLSIILSNNSNILLAEALIFALMQKRDKKNQGCFLSSPIIFTKPNFEEVISLYTRNFSFSLRFCFDSGIDKNRPFGCMFGTFQNPDRIRIRALDRKKCGLG